MLADFRVEQIVCRSAERIEIEVRRGTVQGILVVEQPGVSPHDPPRKAAGRSLFYNLHQHRIPPAELDALLDALVLRLTPTAPP
jgi:hypothetical protein